MTLMTFVFKVTFVVFMFFVLSVGRERESKNEKMGTCVWVKEQGGMWDTREREKGRRKIHTSVLLSSSLMLREKQIQRKDGKRGRERERERQREREESESVGMLEE